jgi:hypothetical protein
MNDLLAPADERDLTVFLCETLGARLLLSDVITSAGPSLAANPLTALPEALPGPAFHGDRSVRSLTFWLPSAGPVRTLADAPVPDTPLDRVARRISTDAADSAGVRVADLIDLESSPVLNLRRSTALSPHRLAPGAFYAMPVKAAALPAEVRAAYNKARRWLKKRAVKVDPFEHCPEVRSRRPNNLGPLGCWVQPEAWRLVEAGTEIWPWNA